MSNFVLVVQKRLVMNKFVRTKSHTEVNFQKSFFSSCIQDGLSLCTYVAVFLCGVRWRYNRARNLEPRFLVIFHTLRKHSVANYAWIWTLLSPSVTRPFQCIKSYLVLSIGGATRFAKFAAEIFQNAKIGRRVVPNTSYGYY